MASEPRYYNVFRHRPSGREEKRLLNRARKCRFCPQALGTDRALFRAYTGFMGFAAWRLRPSGRGGNTASPFRVSRLSDAV